MFEARFLQKDFLLFASLLLVVEFVRGALLVSFLPIYAEKVLHLPLWIIGLAITAHYVMDTGLKIAMGYLLDRFSMRWIAFIGMIISWIGLFQLQYADKGWMLVVSAALFGAGASPIWIIGLTKVKQNNRATQMGFLYTVWLLGMGLGPVVSNFLLDWSAVLTFWLLLSAFGIGCLLSAGLEDNGIKRQADDIYPFLNQWLRLWIRLKQIKPLIPGMILQTLGASMLVPVLPSFVEDRLGFGSSEYSYILMTGGAFAILGLVPMGKLSDTYGRKWFLVIGFIAFSISLLFITKSNSLIEGIVWAIVLGISYSAVLPAWNAILSYNIPSSQEGMGWGVFSTVEGIGVMVGPVVGGALASGINTVFPIIVSSVLFATIGLFYLLFPFHKLQGRRI
ncbi:MFS transporter [Ferviditalea candida]|uniref:MFS transporter n=1 Tax=Ferviditalea candida TaxID=3108399 RepID=A0ABU5ZM06_9BACL|nr:MFS transporter [Paenibacillaceae bacterium T2]